MKLATGDMWSMYGDAYCITTNGVVTPSRRAVMGRGLALEAKERFPGVDIALADRILRNGHRTQIIDSWAPFSPASSKSPTVLVSFPTKNDWRDPSDLDLIVKSSHELMTLIEEQRWADVLLPAPGTGNGWLKWDVVEEAIAPILDERVTVVSRAWD